MIVGLPIAGRNDTDQFCQPLRLELWIADDLHEVPIPQICDGLGPLPLHGDMV
jgi:hypothetical protein